MLELPPEADSKARPKLTPQAARRGRDVRCRRRHLLAAAVPTPWGPWVAWHGGLWGWGWLCGWLDEVADPAAQRVWCAPCHTNQDVDLIELADFTARRRMR
jgi:hypothetical protein